MRPVSDLLQEQKSLLKQVISNVSSPNPNRIRLALVFILEFLS